LLVYRSIYYWAPLALATTLFVIVELWRNAPSLARERVGQRVRETDRATACRRIDLFVRCGSIDSGATPAIDARLRHRAMTS